MIAGSIAPFQRRGGVEKKFCRIGKVREGVSGTYDGETALHVRIRELLAIVVDERERPSHFRLPHPFRHVGNPPPFQSGLLRAEVDDQARAYDEEEDGCFDGVGT